MRYNIKIRLAQLCKTQVWLILELYKKGVRVNAPQLSSFIKGSVFTPKSEMVLKLCDEIIKSHEKTKE